MMLLHGYPSWSKESYGDWKMIPLLEWLGYRTIAIDMPGCGGSGGIKLKTRSEHNIAKGGACDVCLFVCDYFGERTMTVVGCDWGGFYPCFT